MSLPLTKIRVPGIKSVIGVMSGKGGVGKSFVAANLAVSLAKMGKKVGLLDADITYPNAFKILGITAKIATTAENKLTPINKWGVTVVSMAGLCATEDEAIMWRGPIISKIIQQMLKETAWGELDALIIDFPTGTNDSTFTILQSFSVDGVIVVTTPQALSMMDARRAMNAASFLRVPMVGVVENMRGEIFGEGGGNRLADMYRTQFLGSIPLRKQIVSLCDQGTPAVLHLEELEMIFSRISRTVLEKILAPM